MSVKQRIIHALTTPAVGSSPYDIVTNCDHIMRRLFRLFIEGSLGDGSMNTHRETVKALHDIVNQPAKASHRALRSWVIYQHTSFIATEFKCSPSHAQKCVVQAFNAPALQHYTAALMSDARDFYDDNKSALEVNE